MFHQANNLFFGRRHDGSVRILKLNHPLPEWPRINWVYPGETILDVTISPDQWASLVQCVSPTGNPSYENIDYTKGTL